MKPSFNQLPLPVTTPAIVMAGSSQAVRRCHRNLARAGQAVASVRNWLQVLKLLAHEQVRLLILEPELKGLQVVEGLRLVHKTNPQVMSLVLGPLSPELQSELLNAGAEGVLPADLPAAVLVDWVQSYVQRQRLRQENEALRSRFLEVEAYLAHILEQLDEGILTTDLEGNIQSANRLVYEFLHQPSGSLANIPLKDINFMGDGMRNLSQAVKRVLEEGSYEGRFLLTPATGAPFPVYFRGTVYQQEHRQAGTILVFRDLTAQEALELRVEESERLAALAQIASGMAHEIRNPLMAVGGLIRRCDRCLPEEHTAKAYLPAVLENVRRMEAMVKEIEEYVSYVRVAEDKQGLIDLKAVLHLALARLEGSTDLQNVRLKVESLGGLLVQGDELSLVEMFYQLFANAVEAMPQGGRLHLQVDQKDGQALVRITDSGKGIAPEHLSNLSHPFFTTKMTGAGMGLTKVYMIAGRHRGQIRVDSQTGQGTTFKVTLPLAVAGSQ